MKPFRPRRTATGTLLTLTACLLSSTLLHAVTTYTSTSEDDWTNPSYWSGGTVPTGAFGQRLNFNGGTTVTFGDAQGTVDIGSSVSADSRAFLIGFTGGTGTLNVTGGILQATAGAAGPSSGALIGANVNNAVGVLNVSGGIVDLTTTDNGTGGNLSIGILSNNATAAISGTLTLSGTGIVRADQFRFNENDRSQATGTGGITGILNLNGGTLETNSIREGAAGGQTQALTSSTVNFNGGLWKVTGGSGYLSASVDTVNVLAGGARIETTGNVVEMSSSLTGSAGDGGITKTGDGTLKLNVANTHTGTTTASGGIILVSDNAALGTTASGTFVNPDATLQLADGVTITGESITINSNGSSSNFRGGLQAISGATATWAGDIILAGGTSNNGRIGARGTGHLTLSGAIMDDGATASKLSISTDSGAKVTISGTANTYTGGTDIVRGNLELAATNALPTSTNLNISNFDSTGKLDLAGFDQTVARLTNSFDGVVTNSNASQLSTFTIDGSSSGSNSLAITGNLALVKSGSSAATFSGDNSYTGSTTVNAGLLILASNTALGDTSGQTFVTTSSESAVRLNDGVTITGETISINSSGGVTANYRGGLHTANDATATWAGDIILEGGSGTAGRLGSNGTGNLIVSGEIMDGASASALTISTSPEAKVTLSGSNSYTGDTQIARGNLALGADNSLPTTTTVVLGQFDAGASLDLNGFNQTVARVTQVNDTTITNSNGSQLSTLTINEAGTISTSISFTGNLGVTKDGAGTFSLAGTSTHTGPTTITGGTLGITGGGSIDNSSSIAISGASTTFDVSTISSSSFTLGAAQTLTGNGTLNAGGKTVSIAGAVAPGNSPGTMSVNLDIGGAMEFVSGSMLAFELGTTSDMIAFVTLGDWLTGSGNATLDITQGSGFDYASTYTIFDNVSTTGYTLAGITGYDTGAYTANFGQDSDSYVLSFTPIPEPSSALLASLTVAALLLRRRR